MKCFLNSKCTSHSIKVEGDGDEYKVPDQIHTRIKPRCLDLLPHHIDSSREARDTLHHTIIRAKQL